MFLNLNVYIMYMYALERLMPSKTRIALLRYLYSIKGETNATEIMEKLSIPKTNAWEELKNLEAAGVISSVRRGTGIYFRTKRVRSDPLKKLVMGDIYAQLAKISEIKGISHVILYGSHLETPDAKSDIDLLILGKPDLDALNEKIRKLEREIGKEIDYIVMSAEEFKKKDAPFLRTLLKRYRLLWGDKDEFAGIAEKRIDKASKPGKRRH